VPKKPTMATTQGAQEYLEEQSVESTITRAVAEVLKTRPADAKAAIAAAISSASPAKQIAVGDTFPMDVVVHQGFAGNTPDAPKPMSHFLKGKKALVVSLPGAFTPT